MFERFDRTDFKVLNLIADEPYRKFYLREIARELKISPSSAKKALDIISKMNLIKQEKIANLRMISGNIDENLLKQYKITRNIEVIKPLLEKLEPSTTIVLYGSFAKGENDQNSDIDLLVITNKKDAFSISEHNGFPAQIIKMSAAEWSQMKKSNSAFAIEVKKGIVLKGEMPE